MIALVEGAERQKTPNEIALNILLAGLTHHLRVPVATHPEPFAAYAGGSIRSGAGGAVRHPDPDHHRRAAVGDRHRRHGPPGAASTCSPCRAARSRRRATSTRCCSTRPAPSRSATARPEFLPVPGVDRARPRRRRPARLAGRRDARGPLDRGAGQGKIRPPRPRDGARSTPSSSLLGQDAHERRRHRRAPRSARAPSTPSSPRGVQKRRTAPRGPRNSAKSADRRSRAGGTPLAVSKERPAARRRPSEGHRQGRHPRALRHCADGHPHRHDHRRQPADRAAIAAEAGVDDFLAEATPRDKLADPRREQARASWCDVRRRHQRRAGARPGRCRRRR